MDLIRDVLQMIVSGPDADGAEARRRSFRTSARAAETTGWPAALTTLEQHRLLPATGEALVAHGLDDAVPPAVRDELVEAHKKTTLTNTVLLHTLARALAALAERGVTPVVWKGVVLADRFYRDPGSRWMGDVDLSIEPDEVDATTEAFAAIGLRRPPALQTDDAVYFEHPAGIMFDVHHRVRLFEGRAAEDITLDVEPVRCPAPSMRVLGPDAMLVHLVVHLDGHLDETGLILSWLLDLAVVLEQWGELVDVAKVADMMPEPRHLTLMHRITGFLRDEIGAAIPASLVDETVAPLTLPEILRSRRLAQWDLPGWRGWARLGACRLGARDTEGRPWPTWGDLLCWPADVVRRKRSAA